jgi:DNA repair exonuclease SbcCD ATPase subunit
MIERLGLRRWRSFDSIDLDFGRGTTFIVAPNGAGKTSLLLGMAWAIFGDHSNVDARACIRAGATGAEATVTLLLDGERRLNIRRTLAPRGRSSTDHDLEGVAVTDDELVTILQESFGARPAIAAQLSLMPGGGHVASEQALDLKDHLHQAFGITDLLAAADRAAAMVKAAERQRQQERSVAKLSVDTREAKRAELVQLQLLLDEATGERTALAAALDVATRQREASAAWSRHDAASQRWQAVLADLVAAAGLLGLDEHPDRLPASIGVAADRARSQLADATEHVTEARARARGAQQALAMLERDDPSCPTCLRPFHGTELTEALQVQRAMLDEANVEEARWQAVVSDLGQLLERLVELGPLAAQLPAEPEHARPAGDPDAALRLALAALQTHDKHVGRLEQERDAIARTLASDDTRHRAEQAQRYAYRHEAVTTAAALALADAADQLTQGYIEPLSRQIRWRWKALYGEEGLQLKPDGTIVRVAGDRELPWHTLSGGERIWARLVTHLLVLATSTRLSFAWFDEPLEHLDPRARRAVAAALATATRAGGPRQLVVTTYEHAIARQLAADVPEASIRYMRPSLTGDA